MSKIKARNGILHLTGPARFERDGDHVLVVHRSGALNHVGRMSKRDFDATIDSALAVRQRA